jgi:hypothetical protein
MYVRSTYPCELDLFVDLSELTHLVSELLARLVPLGPEQQGHAFICTGLL